MVQEALAEAETAPAKPETKPTVAPGKPGEKPKPRRPLGNPDVKPNPKAMNEEEMLNKIIARFKAKKLNENVEQKYKHFNKVTRIGGNILNNIFAYPDPNGSATKEQLSKYETKEGQAKFKVIFCKTKEEAEKKAKYNG